MKTVNALTIRNRLGEVLEYLETTGEPVLLSKARKVRAALIPIEDFKVRFLDRQAEEERKRFLESLEGLAEERVGETDSLQILRNLRGYED